MKITIDMDNLFGCDEEGGSIDLEDMLRVEIINNISSMMLSRWSNDIHQGIKNEVLNKLSEETVKKLSEISEEIIKTEVIPGNGTPMTVKEYIVRKITENSGWQSVGTHIEKLGENLKKEFLTRFDNQFASVIITKLKQADMLKPGVADALLENKE